MMLGMMDRCATPIRPRRLRARTRAVVACEGLEGRELLSAGFGFPGGFGGGGLGMRMAEFAPGGGGGMRGAFGGGEFGFRGGSSVASLLISPLLAASGAESGSTSYTAMRSSAVQQAMQTLQTDLKNDTPSGAQPTFESMGQLEDDLDAVRKGTLSGSAADTQIASDQAAMLTSMGLTQTQITQIQTDAQAVVTAIQTSSSSSTTSTSTSSSTSTTSSSTSTTSSSTTSTVQTALQTLQSDLKSDTPSGAQPTHASVGAVMDDLEAIRKGTLSGSAAVTKVQTDAAAVLSSMGLTQTQISQIQSDQQAVESAKEANSSSSTSTTSATTSSTLQSVSPYLVGIPGLSGFGMRGFGGGHRGMRAFFRY
jgi:hypothetical protein